MAKKNYEGWSKPDLIKEIKKLEKRKKYGIVWEDKSEDVAKRCQNELPVLEENTKREIKRDAEKPFNILIEGDNYHTLSVLNYTHKGNIDVIYIDPPYNTGNKTWRYNNNYVELEDSFRHSKWLSFMEKRLKLAKNVLKKTGSIVISIDHCELFNLGALCDEIFGENNRLGVVAVVHKSEGRNQEKFFSTSHEYMLVYAKNKNYVHFKKALLDPKIKASFDREDSKGKYKLKNYLRSGGGDHNLRKNKPHFFYPIYVNRDLKDITLEKKKGYYEVLPITSSGQERTWKTIKKTFLKSLKNEEIVAEKDKRGKVQIFGKYREDKGQLIKTYWMDPKYHAIHHGTKVLENIMGSKLFDYPKSIYLVMDILKVMSSKNAVVLDFFAGSGTTAQSVLELNEEDGGNRKYILCTNNENKICEEVCYPRIKKVINGYKGNGGLKSNLKYFRTDFVDAKPTDRNKRKLVDKSTEMLCLRENCFDEVKKGKQFRIFKNREKYLGIIYDDEGIDPFKKEIKRLNKNFIVYVFSLDESAREEEFEDVISSVDLKPIPAVILNVYKRILK
jgi:adenine-specific DNA-methyltransferase